MSDGVLLRDAGTVGIPHAGWPTPARTREFQVARLCYRFAVPALLLAYACVRLAIVREIPLNSDEPQHAHVAWALSRGLVPYRDVFDNHAPLFQMLFAPLVRWIGEVPDVMQRLRIAIIPIAVAALWLTARIGRTLWGRRAAFWGCAFACAIPSYLQEAGEFRTDALWAMAWIAAVMVAVTGSWNSRRAFGFGLLVGIAFSISLKTLVLVAGFSIAWVAVAWELLPRQLLSRTFLRRSVAPMLAGVVVVPSLVVAWVAIHGGFDAMRYDVVDHNLLPALGRTHGAGWRLPLMIGLLLLLPIGIRRLSPGVAESSLQMRRCLVPASALAYALLLFGAWPLLARQDLLPCVPLLAIGLAGWWQSSAVARQGWIATLAIVACLGLWFSTSKPWIDRLAGERAALADMLAVTTPRDLVMDDKGAAIFRMRPFYFALETVTLKRLERGLIIDDIPARLVRTNTHVLWMQRLPKNDAAFVAANFVSARNGLKIAGKDLGHVGANETRAVPIALPGIYALWAGGASSRPAALIDGSVLLSPRWLASGIHSVSVAEPGRYMLLWQPAARLFATRTP